MSDDFLTRRKAQLEKEQAENKPIKPALAPIKVNKKSEKKSSKNQNVQDIINIIEKAKSVGEELEKQRVQRNQDLEYSYEYIDPILPPKKEK